MLTKKAWIVLPALMALLVAAPANRAAEPKDIVETAVGAGQFKYLAKCLETAGLVDTLKGKGPFTVFAPTDAAFEKLGKEQIEALLKDKEKLAAILKYHVVSDKVMAAQAAKLDKATTVQGKALTIKAEGGKVMINNAKVIKADIQCSNGVIHVIDTVLIPE